jgi:hypothetical protein
MVNPMKVAMPQQAAGVAARTILLANTDNGINGSGAVTVRDKED